eukprot:766272-Hanusia_phi.AAC.5
MRSSPGIRNAMVHTLPGNDGSLKLVRTVEDLAANKAVDNRKRLNPRQRAALKKKQQKPT